MTEKNSPEFDRRSVLKSASAVAGLGLTGEVTAISSHGDVLFSELRLNHDVQLPETEEYYFPFFHVDEFGRTYVLDKDKSTLYVNERYSPGKLKTVKANSAIVGGELFSSLPIRRKQCQSSSLPTEINSDFRATKRLSFTDGYREPQITVTENDETLFVEVDSKEISVGPRSQEEFALPDQEITVEAYKTIDKSAEEITIAGGEEWQEPWRKPKQREYMTKTVTVTPKVQVRNHGSLDVVGVRSKAPQPHTRN